MSDEDNQKINELIKFVVMYRTITVAGSMGWNIKQTKNTIELRKKKDRLSPLERDTEKFIDVLLGNCNMVGVL